MLTTPRLLHCAMILTGLLSAAALDAQSVLRWEEFRTCQSCELTFDRVVALGQQDGQGVIESELARVVAAPGRGFLVFGRGGTTGYSVSLFDASGNFARSFGREGDGPGETRTIADVAFMGDDQVMVLDAARQRWLTFRETGEFLSEEPLHGVQAGRFRLAAGDTAAVIAVMDRRPASAGFPLHLVDLRDAGIVRRFGAGNRSWHVGTPFAGALTLGESGTVSESVWWGHVGRPHVEQWSLAGSHLATVTGDLETFPVAANSPRDRNAPPAVAMSSFAVDGQDRLWLLTFVPGPRWRQVTRQGPEGAIPPDRMGEYQNLRLDIFDLEAKTHLGHRIWPERNVTLVTYGDDVLVSVLEYETPLWPRLVLYEVSSDVCAVP